MQYYVLKKKKNLKNTKQSQRPRRHHCVDLDFLFLMPSESAYIKV